MLPRFQLDKRELPPVCFAPLRMQEYEACLQTLTVAVNSHVIIAQHTRSDSSIFKLTATLAGTRNPRP